MFTASASSTPSAPWVADNALLPHLRTGGSVIGTMIASSIQLSTVQVMRNSGMDFVIIDNEHGMFTNATIVTCVATVSPSVSHPWYGSRT